MKYVLNTMKIIVLSDVCDGNGNNVNVNVNGNGNGLEKGVEVIHVFKWRE